MGKREGGRDRSYRRILIHARVSSSRFNISRKKRIHPVLSPRWPSDYAIRRREEEGEEPAAYLRDESGAASIRDGDPGSLTLFNRGNLRPVNRGGSGGDRLACRNRDSRLRRFSFYAEREREEKK